ncbi:DUF2514 family protein [Flavobacterium sp.]|jgi:hypothetical protein|uniref:DUF2514 family protein n=1 Tax=Flavobacterium sp. TaxID=239 RepID=UPI0037C09801
MISLRAKLIALVFYGCAGIAIGAYAVDSKWQSDWDSHMLADAHAQVAAAESAARDQAKILTELEQSHAESEKRRDALAAAERHSAELSGRLHDAIEARKRLLQAGNTGAVAARANAATDALVLAELFGRAEQRATNLAGYADKHRAALMACRAEYEAVR